MNFSSYKTRDTKAAPDGLRAAMCAQRSVSVKRFCETASGVVFLSYVVLFIVLLMMWLCGCSARQGFLTAGGWAPPKSAVKIIRHVAGGIAGAAIAVPLPSAVAQFHPIHRCTNCPPILPTTNIVVAWSYPQPGYNFKQFGDLRLRTNYLQVWYCPAPGALWSLWTNTTVSPVVLPCTNSMGLYGFQLAWL